MLLARCTGEIRHQINGSPDHLELCEKGVYQTFFLNLLRSGYEIKKIDLSHCATDTKDIQAKKGDQPAMMAIKK